MTMGRDEAEVSEGMERAGSNSGRADRSDNRSKLEYAFTVQLILFARRYRAILDERLRPLGYGSARMEALSTIQQFPNATAQIELARRIGIEGPTFTRMLAALESEGLIERIPDPSDRRAKLLKLTPAGTEALHDIMTVSGTLRDEVLCDLSEDELRAVNDVTRRLLPKVID